MTELVVVVAVLAILAAVAVPRFALFLRRSNERGSVAKLRSLKTALVLYCTEQEGVYPADLSPFTTPGGRHSGAFLPIYVTEHGYNASINVLPDPDPAADTGKLAYISQGPGHGTVYIECTHRNLEGKVWSQY